jgi:hypothetical protein
MPSNEMDWERKINGCSGVSAPIRGKARSWWKHIESSVIGTSVCAEQKSEGAGNGEGLGIERKRFLRPMVEENGGETAAGRIGEASSAAIPTTHGIFFAGCTI